MKLQADLIDRLACAAWAFSSLAALMWVYGEVIVCNPEADWPNASHAVCMAIHWPTPC